MGEVIEQPQPKESPIAILRQQLDGMSGQFSAALPAHIPVERFSRVLMTAIQNNPDLLSADRKSLWNSAMKAAQDGLLPDGREGAIVIYNTKERVRQPDNTFKDHWVNKAQWMPMVQGIMKKARNSGEIASISAGVVYGGDQFRYWVDDDGEHLIYEPCDNPDTETVRRVYAMAKLKDGTRRIEVLTPTEVEKIRSISRSKDKGPWVQWWSEMAKKSAIRRLSKTLPMSTDLDDLIRRDDNLYDFNAAREATQAKQGLSGKLDVLARLPSERSAQPRQIESVQHDDDGVVTEESADGGPKEAPSAAQPSEAGTSAGGEPAKTSPATSDPSGKEGSAASPADSKAGGAATKKDEPSKQSTADASPKTELEYITHAQAWIDALDDAEAGEKKWASEKSLRNKANVGGDAREALQAQLKEKIGQIKAANEH